MHQNSLKSVDNSIASLKLDIYMDHILDKYRLNYTRLANNLIKCIPLRHHLVLPLESQNVLFKELTTFFKIILGCLIKNLKYFSTLISSRVENVHKKKKLQFRAFG